MELCSECYVFFHNALLCSSVVRLKEAMDQDMNQDADITSIFKFYDFFDDTAPFQYYSYQTNVSQHSIFL